MGVGVGLGIADFPFSSANAFWKWVALCEEGGIDSLWQTDRLVSHQPFLECLSTMAAIAGATERIKFGMSVCSVALRDPLVTAKQCATIDYLSNGRLLPAFGVGSRDAADWSATGRTFKGVGKQVDEALEIISRLWSEDSVTFAGEHYQYTDAYISPRPVQKRFPLWIGGSSKPAIRRTARFGTGWQAGRETPAEVAPAIVAIKEAAAEQGRSIDHDHFGTGFFFRFGKWDEECVAQRVAAYAKRTPPRDPTKSWAVGDAADILARIREYVDAGVYKFVLRPIGDGDDELMAQTRMLAQEVIPEAIKFEPRK
jgi:probable F420-dependent oxidoreductase